MLPLIYSLSMNTKLLDGRLRSSRFSRISIQTVHAVVTPIVQSIDT